MCTLIEFYDKDALKNILAVLSIRPQKVVYLYDREIEDMNFFKSLEKCLKKHIPDLILEICPVNINHLGNVYEKAMRVIRENSNCVMDLTGGSELMILGGYKAGVEKNIRLVYTDIVNGRVEDIFDTEQYIKTVNISIDDFIDAKGACLMGNSHKEPLEEEYDNILKMCDFLFSHLDKWKDTCNFLQTAAAIQAENGRNILDMKSKLKLIQKDGRKVQGDKSILQGFQKNGFIKDLNFTNETVRFRFAHLNARQYMINFGVWLELFVFIHAKKIGAFDDVKLGAMIDWDAYDGIVVTGNEIDVILTERSMPVFISCKLRETNTAALNELLIAKKRLGGWFSKCIIVTFGNDKKNNSGAYQRAKELGIAMLDKQDILSKNFGERLARTVKEHDIVGLKWKNV